MLCLRGASYTVMQTFLNGQNMIVNTVWSVSIKSMFHMVFSLKLAHILQLRYCLFMFSHQSTVWALTWEKILTIPKSLNNCVI